MDGLLLCQSLGSTGDICCNLLSLSPRGFQLPTFRAGWCSSALIFLSPQGFQLPTFRAGWCSSAVIFFLSPQGFASTSRHYRARAETEQERSKRDRARERKWKQRDTASKESKVKEKESDRLRNKRCIQGESRVALHLAHFFRPLLCHLHRTHFLHQQNCL